MHIANVLGTTTLVVVVSMLARSQVSYLASLS